MFCFGVQMGVGKAIHLLCSTLLLKQAWISSATLGAYFDDYFSAFIHYLNHEYQTVNTSQTKWTHATVWMPDQNGSS